MVEKLYKEHQAEYTKNKLPPDIEHSCEYSSRPASATQIDFTYVDKRML
jgi:hypothetical protein